MTVKCRIVSVSNDGFMTVRWKGADGPEITYPIPTDAEGAPLAGAALDEWLAEQWLADVRPRVERRPAALAALRARVSASFSTVPPAALARAQARLDEDG